MAITDLKKSIVIKLPPMHLDKNDLEGVIKLLKVHYSIREIIVDRYSLNYVEEIPELTIKESDILRIFAFIKSSINPEISIYMSSRYRTIEVSSRDDTIAMGVATQIKQFLNKKKRFGYTGDSFVFALLFLFAIWAVLYSVLKTHYVTIPLVIVAVSFIIFSLSYGLWTFKLYLTEKPIGFFKRKKDDILLAIISGASGLLLGIIGTLLAQLLINKYFPPPAP